MCEVYVPLVKGFLPGQYIKDQVV